MALLWGTQTASASPTSAELDPPRWKHDVFLSFRGQDTRRGFVSHLDHELQYRQEMKTFKDDRDLEVGATISPELLTAIEQSHLAIIVLSPNYASSTWSLDELSKILECMEDTKRILPIFYHVDPSDVRNQRGSFAEALTKHEERFSDDVEKLNRWRAALRKVANLTGLDSKTYKSEAKLIEDIVKRVLKKVHPTFTLLDSEEKLVGIDFALEQLRLQLDLEGTCAIEAIVLHLPKLEVVHWNCTKAFSKMHKLRLLEFDNVIFSSGPKDLPNSLRIIRWSWYPSKSLPPRFHPRFLVKLEMPHSKLIRLWDGAKDFPKLKYIDLSYSDKLSSTPDFTCVPILKELKLKSCTNLVDVHASIAVLKRLKHLDLSDCKSIKSLPSKVEMDSLEYFSLSGCSKVKKLPEFEGHMKNLFKLILKGTAVEQIPSSIEGLVGLAVQGKNNCESLLGQILYMQISSKHVKLPGEMECLEELELSGTAMRELLAVMTNRKYVSLRGSVAKSSTSTLWALFGFRKSLDPKPDPWGLVLPSLYRLRSLTEINLIGSNNFEELFPDNISCLSSLNHITSYQCRLMSLTELNLSDCNIFEGVIPDDIGNFSSLERLILSGNNFVSLPASIRFLYKLCSLDLGRCERLAQLPDLPSKRSKRSLLLVNVSDCTSLKRLSDPSKLSEEANVYDFMFSCLNCFRLVEDEGWINRIFSRIMKLAVEGIYPVFDHCTFIVCPGSEIPDWFNNRSVGDSITVELPLPPQPCSNWIGIASCVVFADSEYLENPASVVGYDHFRIECLRGPSESFEVGHLGSQHLWVFYLPRDHPSLMDASSSHQFSFEAFYDSNRASLNRLKTSSIIKKCGARLVYKRDLKEFSQRLKIGSLEEFSQRLKIGSGSSDDDDFNELWIQSQRELWIQSQTETTRSQPLLIIPKRRPRGRNHHTLPTFLLDRVDEF